MTDEIGKNTTTRPTSAAGDKAKATRVSAEFKGVSRKNGAAVFEVTYSDRTVKRKESPKDEMLAALKQILEKPNSLDNKNMFINGSNFARIVNAYKKAGHLGDELTGLLKQTQEALRNRLKLLAAPPASKQVTSTANPVNSMLGMGFQGVTETTTSEPKPGETNTQTTFDAGAAARDIASLRVAFLRETQSPENSQALAVENFNQREDKDSFLRGLFSEKSRPKTLSNLAPHFRFILQQPNLANDKLRQAQSNALKLSQQSTDLNKLRDALRTDVLQNKITNLQTWLKTGTGAEVAANLEAVLYATAAHIHGQIQHQLTKPRPNETTIENQIVTYVQTTNVLAAIVRSHSKK